MKKLALFLALSCFGLAAFLAWFVPVAWISEPATNAPFVTIHIESGDKLDAIAQNLKERGIIASSFAYTVYAKFDGSTEQARPGDYRLKSGMNLRSIARALSAGPMREEVTITIPEGKTMKQIAEILGPHGISVETFMAAAAPAKWSKEFAFLNDLPKGATLEGFLFPDTYRVWKEQLPEGLIRKQLEEFAKRVPSLTKAKTGKPTLSMYEIVILASIVEREVAGDADRKIVSDIFWRRLREGMPLQSDATVNYATNAARARATYEDLEIDSPYNSYRYKGLPPGPIANPGDAALEATLNPEDTGYRFFLTDDAGKAYYAKTFDGHKENRRNVYGE